MSQPILLERDEYLADARQLFTEAGTGSGHLLFMAGEAGVGKTSVISHILATFDPTVRRLTGSCEPGLTPSPLWPMREMAVVSGWAPGNLVASHAPQDEIFQQALADLRDWPETTILVFEDVHWADDSTLDFLRFLGRRIHETRVLAIASYRNDDLRQIRPLKIVLGDLATSPAVRRMTIAPLSFGAVAQLARGHAADVQGLYDRSLGNPFLVTEMLASGGELPETVKDAVLARINTLSDGARTVLGYCAVRGPATDRTLLAGLPDAADVAYVEECIESGILREARSRLIFRHELIREAILSTISLGRQAEMSGRLFSVLEADPTDADPALLARLSEAAGMRDCVSRYAIIAGDRATELRSYREAAAQYRRAIEFSHRMSPQERSEILHKLAEVTYYCGRGRTGIGVLNQLIDSLRRSDEWAARAEHQAWLANILVEDCCLDEARLVIQEAIAGIDAHPLQAVHGVIYQNYASVLAVGGQQQEAISWGERAIKVAEAFEDRLTVARAMVVIGTCRLALAIDESIGICDLEQAAALARANQLDSVEVHALGCLGSYFACSYRSQQASQYLNTLVSLASEFNLDCWHRFGEYCLGISAFYEGEWDTAATFAPAMTLAEAGCLEGQVTGLLVIGRIRARRGDPDAIAVIEMAASITPPDAPPFMRARLHLARAEAAWLAGDRETTRRESERGLQAAIACTERFSCGELAYYLSRSGESPSIPFELLKPQAFELRHDWLGASAAWHELGCPYEEARAQFESGDREALLAAHAIFERLGAAPMLAEVKRSLRNMGTPIPRGPRQTTRGNQFGLTVREAEVVRFVRLGWTNNEIADHLFVSTRTVEHHLSSVYGKLGVRSRREVNALVLGQEARPTSEVSVAG